MKKIVSYAFVFLIPLIFLYLINIPYNSDSSNNKTKTREDIEIERFLDASFSISDKVRDPKSFSQIWACIMSENDSVFIKFRNKNQHGNMAFGAGVQKIKKKTIITENEKTIQELE